MERCNSKTQTSARPQLVQSSDARYFAPADHFRVEVQLASCDSELQLPEPESHYENGIRARIPRNACPHVTSSRRQKTVAGLYSYQRQRHTKLCPQLGGTQFIALASLSVFIAAFYLDEIVLLTEC